MVKSELTSEQRQQIAIEEYKSQPLMSICQGALLMGAKVGIEAESENVEVSTKATILGQRYECKMEITWEKI